MSGRIHIVTVAPGPVAEDYMIARLSREWERQGFHITTGPLANMDDRAALTLMHVDRTHVDPALLPANPDGRPLLNKQILDISKKTISTLRIQPGDTWRGPVIIKTDLNHFGKPEWHGRSHTRVERWRRHLARRCWRLARLLPPNAYPILPHWEKAPAWVWRDPGLIVERFMPERDGDLYCLRGWIFFGSRGFVYRMTGPNPIVKSWNAIRYEFLDSPPAELVAIRRSRGLDFGKFDYVVVDGVPILIDINKTPVFCSAPAIAQVPALAAGLSDYLAAPASS